MGLEEFTVETFGPHVGTTFEVPTGSATLELVLEEATPIEIEGHPDQTESGARKPFSLMFSGASEPALVQGTYEVNHHDIGSFPLFVVPVGPEEGRMRYHAIFA